MNETMEVQGYPGTIEEPASTDTAKSLAAGTLTRSTDSRKPIAVTITVEDNDIRVCYEGSTPVGSGGTAKGHVVAAGQSLRLTNPAAIQLFKYVSKTAGSHAKLRVTPEFSCKDR